MLCYAHPAQPAVGICRSCDKGVCKECALELSFGLACSERCRERGIGTIKMIDNALAQLAETTRVEIVAPSSIMTAETQRQLYHNTRLACHIREVTKFRRGLGYFVGIIGMTLAAIGFNSDNGIALIFGLVSLCFSAYCFTFDRKAVDQIGEQKTTTQ